MKVGDSNTYVVKRAKSLNANTFSGGIILANGSLLRFNITEGLKFVIKVVEINKSALGQEQVWVTTKVNIKDVGEVTSAVQRSIGVINPSFENKTSAIDYYNSTLNPNFQKLTITGDFISITTNNTFSNAIMFSEGKFNWKTGWLEMNHNLDMYSNGTVLTDYLVQKESNSNLINSIMSYTVSATEIGSVLIIVTIPALVVINYRNWSKSKKQKGNSYTNYVKNRFRYSKETTKVKQPKAGSADNALSMIDEILKETDNK